MLTIRALVGFLLLITGSQLYWLFAGGACFIAGDILTAQFLPNATLRDLIVYSLGSGIFGVLLSFPLKRLLVAVGGFFAGGFLSFNLPPLLGISTVQFSWPLFILFGLVAALLVTVWFSWTMLVLSPLTGSVMVAQSVQFASITPRVIFISLLVIGLAVQVIFMQYAEPSLET